MFWCSRSSPCFAEKSDVVRSARRVLPIATKDRALARAAADHAEIDVVLVA
jgi:hypothetical protein